jgi:hypothetical protein
MFWATRSLNFFVVKEWRKVAIKRMSKEGKNRRDGKGVWEKRISKMYRILWKKRRDFALR